MRLSLGQDLRLVQKQVLAPRMIQSMEILQLPILALQERIEQEPDRFTNNELRQLVESTMDRSAAPAKGDPRGAAGKSAGLSVNINFVEAKPSGPVIDAESTLVEVKQIEEKEHA